MRAATCHTIRVHFAKGLCERCYSKRRRLAHLEKSRRQARESQARRRSTPEGKAYARAYDASPKRREVQRAYNRSPKAKVVKFRSQLKKRHGLTVAEFERLWLAQGSECALSDCSPCRGPRCVDHEVVQGQRFNRGILCSKHNRALGLLGDNSVGLIFAFQYLTQAGKARMTAEDVERISHAK